MTAEQLELGQPARRTVPDSRPCGVFEVPPGDFARPGLVNRGFVERSVAAMRAMPDAERELRTVMAEFIESIGAIDRLYRDELNAWATVTRERLWLQYFTADAIVQRLKSAAAHGAVMPIAANGCSPHSSSTPVLL